MVREQVQTALREENLLLDRFADPQLRAFVRNLKQSGLPVFCDLTLEAFLLELEGKYQLALGAGGLGFLEGETFGAHNALWKFSGMGAMPLYENHVNKTTGEWTHLDWPREDEESSKGAKPVIVYGAKGNKQILTLDVAYNKGNFKVEVYWINRNGNLVFLLRQPEIFDLLYPYKDHLIYQQGFFGRAFVELMKSLGAAPAIVRLNEPQLVYVAAAMKKDIDFFNGGHVKSIFNDTKIAGTTHTPESAAIQHDPIGWIESIVGRELVRNWKGARELITQENGEVNTAKGLGEVSTLVNAVSLEHARVTQEIIMPGYADKTIGIQNGSDPGEWYSPPLAQRVSEVGVGSVTGEELYKFGQQMKKELNEFLKRNYGSSFTDINRPLVGLVRRMVDYKEQGILFPILRWIVGDRHLDYEVPWGMEKGLGANLLVGGVGQDDRGRDWVDEFRRQMYAEDLKGKFIFVNDTGIELMRLATSASDIWGSMPRATREASGTSDDRAAFNGHLNIATATGGPLAYIIHGVTGWLIDVFKGWDFGNLVRRINAKDPEVLERFRIEGRKQLGGFLKEGTSQYYNYSDGKGDRTWIDNMQTAFIKAHQEVSIDVMIQKYGLMFESILDGSGKQGYETKYKAWQARAPKVFELQGWAQGFSYNSLWQALNVKTRSELFDKLDLENDTMVVSITGQSRVRVIRAQAANNILGQRAENVFIEEGSLKEFADKDPDAWIGGRIPHVTTLPLSAPAPISAAAPAGKQVDDGPHLGSMHDGPSFILATLVTAVAAVVMWFVRSMRMALVKRIATEPVKPRAPAIRMQHIIRNITPPSNILRRMVVMTLLVSALLAGSLTVLLRTAFQGVGGDFLLALAAGSIGFVLTLFPVHYALILARSLATQLPVLRGDIRVNGRQYANAPLLSQLTIQTAPAISVHMPIHLESFDSIRPHLDAALAAVDVYNARFPGRANVIVSDDGLMVLADNNVEEFAASARAKPVPVRTREETEALARLDYYATHEVAVVARPKPDGTPQTVRRGAFPKASNLNYMHRLVDRIEGGDPDFGRAWVRGDLRRGELLLQLDKDSLTPAAIMAMTAPEFVADQMLAYTQHATVPTNEDESFYARMIGMFIRMLYGLSMPIRVLAGSMVPFMGHNGFVRTEALRALGYWDEEAVSEDLVFAMGAVAAGYHGKYIAYQGMEFGEEVARTFMEEASKFSRYAFGAGQVLFQPVSAWRSRGLFGKAIRGFAGSAHVRWFQTADLLFFKLVLAGLALTSITPFLSLMFVEVDMGGFRNIVITAALFNLIPVLVMTWAFRDTHAGKQGSFLSRFWQREKLQLPFYFSFMGMAPYVLHGGINYFLGRDMIFPVTNVDRFEQRSFRRILSDMGSAHTHALTLMLMYVGSIGLAVLFFGHPHRIIFASTFIAIQTAAPYLFHPPLWKAVFSRDLLPQKDGGALPISAAAVGSYAQEIKETHPAQSALLMQDEGRLRYLEAQLPPQQTN
ncbi:MAG: glycosyltransferase family 2 protein, partial [Candidatus Omnitrophota bacterium]|nr:glycosyltransferase family 2 protein [Candidatus Omnitrophota bacterium]